MKVIEYGEQNAETILFLHGGGLSWWNFRAQALLLADRYHVVLPVLDGHAGADAPFCGIEGNADRIIGYIDSAYGGSVLLIGGLSLGAQILAELLAKRPDACRYAVIESVSVIPSPAAGALLGPSVRASYPLIRKERFARAQMRSLRISENLFEDYYRDTSAIALSDMLAFLKANAEYEAKPSLRDCRAVTRVVVGEKEQTRMLRSAEALHDLLPNSTLEVKAGLRHGEYAFQPEIYVRDLLATLGADK